MFSFLQHIFLYLLNMCIYLVEFTSFKNSTVLFNTVAMSHAWLFKLTKIKIKNSVLQSHQPHVTCSVFTHSLAATVLDNANTEHLHHQVLLDHAALNMTCTTLTSVVTSYEILAQVSM